MIRYPDETRQAALETYRNEGIKTACERFHVPSSTIYRWLNIEKREVLLAQAGNGIPEHDHEETAFPESTQADIQSCEDKFTASAGNEVVEDLQSEEQPDEADIPDMLTLLAAENEKLRSKNMQLRKALQAFVL